MNKNAIQKYAVWARNELIEQVKQRAYQYGISEKGYGDENAAFIAGRVLSVDEKRQRTAFVGEIQKHGYQEAVEEVAYTWFNRFVALRFMEVNDYLPTHVRVFSDATGGFNPEILKDVLHLDLDGLDKAKVSELLNANQTEELYRYLLLTQCNALNTALPEMFEKLGSYTEMLLPNNILKQDGVLGRLVMDIPEEDFRDAVQIIGWMYQYYITELNELVYDGTFSKNRIPKELLSAATTIYTPDWAIRYMVDNSLGKLWLENHPNDKLKANLKYFLEEAEQTPEVSTMLLTLRSQSSVKSPEDIRIIDPCMGSGHILVYAFDVMVQIYESVGVSPRDAAKLILEKNIYGLDIDHRAYQLAYFSLMMKARQYNRRILDGSIQPQVYSPSGYPEGIELGSIIKVDELEPKPQIPKELTLFDLDYDNKLNAWNFRRVLSQKYDVVVTNPPYLGAARFSPKMNDYVVANYPDTKADLSMVMFQHALADLSCKGGFVAFITTSSWLYLSSFEKLRKFVLNGYDFDSLVDFGTELFDGKVGHNPITAWVNRKCHTHRKMTAVRLVDYCYSRRDEKEPEFFQKHNRHFTSADLFTKVPGNPIAYYVSENFIDNFGKAALSATHYSGGRNKTHKNEKYVRFWWEIANRMKWQPYAKGGDFRRWYGNVDTVVDWSDSAKADYDSHGGLYNQRFAGKEGICWTLITSAQNGFRIKMCNEHYDSGAPTIFNHDFQCDYYALAFLNSKVAIRYLKLLNPTINMGNTYVLSLPLIDNMAQRETVLATSKNTVATSRSDWDAFETSFDFKRHPLICGERIVVASFGKWVHEAKERFDALKANEEELNRIFIDIYNLQDELTPEVEDKDVTVRRANLGREIRSLISYAVGCMFGRYSLDTEGLAYAGGDWDAGEYRSFIPDKDNILPICDDEYFDDDIMGRLVDFIRVVYGADTLEENLKFIADALSGKGTPREVIRNYFLNDFYTDHCKTYQKRPIYWLFDSGKKNGFKSLVYLHRYSRDLLAKLRTDYVHEQQERYRTQLSHISAALSTATGSERARLIKQQDKLSEQLKEITAFEEKIHHLADKNIEIDLDDGVNKNYEVFTDILAKIKI